MGLTNEGLLYGEEDRGMCSVSAGVWGKLRGANGQPGGALGYGQDGGGPALQRFHFGGFNWVHWGEGRGAAPIPAPEPPL